MTTQKGYYICSRTPAGTLFVTLVAKDDGVGVTTHDRVEDAIGFPAQAQTQELLDKIQDVGLDVQHGLVNLYVKRYRITDKGSQSWTSHPLDNIEEKSRPNGWSIVGISRWNEEDQDRFEDQMSELVDKLCKQGFQDETWTVLCIEAVSKFFEAIPGVTTHQFWMVRDAAFEEVTGFHPRQMSAPNSEVQKQMEAVPMLLEILFTGAVQAAHPELNMGADDLPELTLKAFGNGKLMGTLHAPVYMEGTQKVVAGYVTA